MSERDAFLGRIVRTSPAAPYLLGLVIAIVIGVMKFYWSPVRHNAPFAIALAVVFGVLVSAWGVQVRGRS